MVKFASLFHGTSSVYKADIQKHGLAPRDGKLYLTTHPLVALLEAMRSVSGEGNLREGYKTGVGGLPLVAIVERSAATKLTLDTEYYDHEDRAGYRASELRYAFTTREPIPSPAVSFIEADLHNECTALLKKIDTMVIDQRHQRNSGIRTERLTFGYAVKVDFRIARVLKT